MKEGAAKHLLDGAVRTSNVPTTALHLFVCKLCLYPKRDPFNQGFLLFPIGIPKYCYLGFPPLEPVPYQQATLGLDAHPRVAKMAESTMQIRTVPAK